MGLELRTIAMPLVYCDQNYVVTAHDGPERYREELRELVSKGAVTFVLSPWHWREMAQDADQKRGDSVANFCDSLNSSWLHERIAIQRREVAHGLFKFIGIQTQPPVMVGDVRDVFHDLTGKWVDRASCSVVAYLRQNTAGDRIIDQVLTKGYEDNQKNIQNFRTGKATPTLLRAVERRYVEILLPHTTPSGVSIDNATEQKFLDAMKVSDFPAISIEMQMMFDRWANGRQLKANDALDQQHAMALPYVDCFVTDDNNLTKIIQRVVPALPHLHAAKLLKKSDFDTQFS